MAVINEHERAADTATGTSVRTARSAGAYEEIADYLTEGYSIWSGEGRHAFAVAPGDTLSANITGLTETGRQLARQALESWTNVSGIAFEFVDDDAHITFYDRPEGAYASAVISGGVIVTAEVNVSTDILEAGTAPGSYAFFTYLHEIGHALGLGHAGPYNGFGAYGTDNVFLNDSFQATAMSYFSQDENTWVDASFAYPVTPMIADIIAIHDLYGAPGDINARDTVYGYQSNVAGYLAGFFRDWTGEDGGGAEMPATLTLYDSGGNDTLDLRTDRHGQRIDLRPEGISDVYGLTGNLVIARGVLIENAIGGHGDDVLRGNALANDLQGRAGADELWGRGGDDVLEGGAGADRLHGGEGLDWVSYRGSPTSVTVNLADGTASGSHGEGDMMTGIENALGSAHDDVLRGDAGANRLAGGPGADLLDGGGGDDWAYYGWSDTAVRVDLGAGIMAGGHAEGDRLVNIANVSGSPHDDVLTGAAGANQLDGGGGDDVLAGGPGADRLSGGGGDDVASYEHSDAAVTVRLHALTARGGGAEGDRFGVLVEAHYRDRDNVPRTETVPDIKHLRGSAHDDTLAGDSRANHLAGGPGDDRLYGGPGGGDDELLGGGGNDALYGGGGNDLLVGGPGADQLRGGPGADTAGYQDSEAAVEVRLPEGVGRGGHAEGDTLSDVENVIGSAHDDVLVGAGSANQLQGGPGADRLQGGPGADWVVYLASDAGVTIDLRDNTAAGGHANGDVISGFENVTGSAHADVLTGTAGANELVGNGGDDELHGAGGDDVLAGGAGADRLFGGAGMDTLSYRASNAGVRVNLAERRAAGGHAEGDVIRDSEHITGSGHGDNLVGDAGANRLRGLAGDDDLHGLGGADHLLGGAGADRLYGGAQGDELWGGAGNDQLFGEPGDDVLHGDEGDDDLHGSAGEDQLSGGDGADNLYGNEGDDALQGGAGNDRLHGNAGADRLDGGAGVDWAFYADSNAGVRVNLAQGTVAGGHAAGDALSGIENLAGSGHDDVLRGDGGANELHGLGGADELYGGAGDDVLQGGAGGDRLNGGAGMDWARYGESEAGVTVRLRSGYANGGSARGDVVTNIEHVSGSGHDDILDGDDGANQLLGGAGDDLLIGNGGADRLDGGPGIDTVDYFQSEAGVRVDLEQGVGAGGRAQGDVIIDVEKISGSEHADILVGDSHSNVLRGFAGDDELYGGAGNDRLVGDTGADRLDGGAGLDVASYAASEAGVTVNLEEGTGAGGFAEGDVITGVEEVWGSAFADVLVGSAHADILSGYDGDDELSGGAGNDNLDGEAGDDHLAGGAGHDWLNGHTGDDEIHGGAGSDSLEGYTGADRLAGGMGDDELFGHSREPGREHHDGSVDTFVFEPGHGEDTIFDFADGEDRIDLSAFNLSGFDALNRSSHADEFAREGTLIDLSAHGGGMIMLYELDIADLDASDFLF